MNDSTLHADCDQETLPGASGGVSGEKIRKLAEDRLSWASDNVTGREVDAFVMGYHAAKIEAANREKASQVAPVAVSEKESKPEIEYPPCPNCNGTGLLVVREHRVPCAVCSGMMHDLGTGPSTSQSHLQPESVTTISVKRLDELEKAESKAFELEAKLFEIESK